MVAEMRKSIEVLVRRNSFEVKEGIQWLVGSQFMPFSILSILQQRDPDLTVEAGISFSSHQTKTSILISPGRFDYIQKITFCGSVFLFPIPSFQNFAEFHLEFAPLKFLSLLFLFPFFQQLFVHLFIGLLFLKFRI